MGVYTSVTEGAPRTVYDFKNMVASIITPRILSVLRNATMYSKFAIYKSPASVVVTSVETAFRLGRDVASVVSVPTSFLLSVMADEPRTVFLGHGSRPEELPPLGGAEVGSEPSYAERVARKLPV